MAKKKIDPKAEILRLLDLAKQEMVRYRGGPSLRAITYVEGAEKLIEKGL